MGGAARDEKEGNKNIPAVRRGHVRRRSLGVLFALDPIPHEIGDERRKRGDRGEKRQRPRKAFAARFIDFYLHDKPNQKAEQKQERGNKAGMRPCLDLLPKGLAALRV